MSSQILALRPITKGVKSKNLQDIITLTDFKKVFYTIHREKLIKILAANGIPERLVRAIEVIYTDTKAKVLSQDGGTELFEIQSDSSITIHNCARLHSHKNPK